MRFLFALILGAALLTGVVYYHDTNLVGGPGQNARPIVNWDVANDVTRSVVDRVRVEFNRLIGR